MEIKQNPTLCITHSLSLLALVLLCLMPTLVQAGGIEFTLNSPLEGNGITNIPELIEAILRFIIIVATPIVVLFIIYSGFQYVAARGNAEQTQKATKSLTYAIMGGILILGAVALSNIITNVVNSFRP